LGEHIVRHRTKDELDAKPVGFVAQVVGLVGQGVRHVFRLDAGALFGQRLLHRKVNDQPASAGRVLRGANEPQQRTADQGSHQATFPKCNTPGGPTMTPAEETALMARTNLGLTMAIMDALLVAGVMPAAALADAIDRAAVRVLEMIPPADPHRALVEAVLTQKAAEVRSAGAAMRRTTPPRAAGASDPDALP
jgi:hypothetical protein